MWTQRRRTHQGGLDVFPSASKSLSLFSGEDEVIELEDIRVMQGIKGVIFQGFRVLAKNPPLGTIIKRVANIYDDGQTLL